MSVFNSRTLPHLVELAYSAALNPAGWQPFLDALSSPFGGASGILYAFDRSREAIGFSYNFGNDPAYIRSYVDYYATLNPYPTAGPLLSGHWHVGKVICATEAVAVDSITTSEFYNDWMRPQGIPADHLGAVVSRDSTSHVTFGLAPDIKMLSRHRDRYARELAIILPHMVRALEIRKLTAAAREAERIAGVALEVIDAAALILDGDGRVLRLNSKAQALMRSERVLGIARDGIVHAIGSAEAKALAGAIARQRAGPVRTASGPLRLTSQRDGARHVAWLVAAPHPDETPLTDRAEPSARRLPPLLVLLMHPVGRRLIIAPEHVRSAFGLSHAEARLVVALVAGRTLADYAGDTGLSPNTVRNHLATVFAKTGTSRQSELVALVIGSLRWPFR